VANARGFAMLPVTGILNRMHQINGVRDPATSFPLDITTDDAGERRQANRAIAISALGLALTGLVELVIALVSGSVALLGDALHNLADFPPSVTPTDSSAPRTSPELVWRW
jgi:hypothetical protein